MNLIIYQELTEIIDKQNDLIAKLVNENAELENMISVLVKESIQE